MMFPAALLLPAIDVLAAALLLAVRWENLSRIVVAFLTGGALNALYNPGVSRWLLVLAIVTALMTVFGAMHNLVRGAIGNVVTDQPDATVVTAVSWSLPIVLVIAAMLMWDSEAAELNAQTQWGTGGLYGHDFDDDGFSDALEQKWGTLIFDSGSTPPFWVQKDA